MINSIFIRINVAIKSAIRQKNSERQDDNRIICLEVGITKIYRVHISRLCFTKILHGLGVNLHGLGFMGPT